MKSLFKLTTVPFLVDVREADVLVTTWLGGTRLVVMQLKGLGQGMDRECHEKGKGRGRIDGGEEPGWGRLPTISDEISRRKYASHAMTPDSRRSGTRKEERDAYNRSE